MKNREEYMASIYAKRDAVLKKRKRNASVAISALCIVFSFCAAAAIVPDMMKKSSPDEITVASTTASHTENTQNDEGIYVTLVDNYLISNLSVEDVEERVESEFKETGQASGDNTVTAERENTTYGQKQFAHHVTCAENESEIALEMESFDDVVSAPSVTRKPSSLGKYSDGEILDAAFNCLSDSEKTAVDGIEPFVTVTRTNSGDEYYDISYKTDNGKIKITLNAENLELVKRSGSFNNTSATTAVPPMVVTTPAYNPNS